MLDTCELLDRFPNAVEPLKFSVRQDGRDVFGGFERARVGLVGPEVSAAAAVVAFGGPKAKKKPREYPSVARVYAVRGEVRL